MVIRQYRVLVIVIGLMLIGAFSLLPRISQAQQEGDASCPALVELALSQVGGNCANLPRNSACYGFNRVESTFSQPVTEGFFTNPAERAELASMKTIQSSPLDLALGQWGVAVLNVQANVPDTLPGQAVTFLLMGDTQVENAVDGGQSVQPITVITQAATALRSAPETNSDFISSLNPGTVLQADALSTDGSAIHVLVNSTAGWIDVSAVNATPQLAGLAATSGTTASPMQAFYFRTGPGQTTCNQTPSLLAIQSPENIRVELTANGANISLGSLITLQVLPDGKTMKLTTLEGHAVLEADTPDQVEVPAGFTTTRCLADPESLGLDGSANDQKVGDDCPWTPPEPTSLDDLDQGQIVQSMLERLKIAAEVTPTPVPEITPEATSEVVDCPFGTTQFHVVSAGENLYRISLRYSTSMGAIMKANGLSSAELIYVGQRLTIPCGVDIGLPTLPNAPTQVPGTGAVGVDCGPFRATSPLDGFAYGSNIFYWDAAPGADGYRVNIYNMDEKGGAQVGVFTTSGGNTNLTADITVESVGYGFQFAWDVQALRNGQIACTSSRYIVPRAPQPGGPPSGPAFTASWVCSSPGFFDVTVANLPAGTTTITINYTGAVHIPASGNTFPVPPYTHSFSGTPGPLSGGSVVANPSGATTLLGSLGVC